MFLPIIFRRTANDGRCVGLIFIKITERAFGFTFFNKVKLIQAKPSIHLALGVEPYKQFGPGRAKPFQDQSLVVLCMVITPPGSDKRFNSERTVCIKMPPSFVFGMLGMVYFLQACQEGLKLIYLPLEDITSPNQVRVPLEAVPTSRI